MKSYTQIASALGLLMGGMYCAVAPAQETAEQVVIENALPAPAEEADGIRMNFRDVPLQTILDYLSKSAGFAIVLEAEVGGTVDVISHQTLSDVEAVQLLNDVLYERGFTAIQNDRILRIVRSDKAGTEAIPVVKGADPLEIPKTHRRVTQIMPMRYANASQLMQNIQPLVTADTIMTANTSSNSLIITDTQINIRRIAEIVGALDTATLSTSTVRVIRLERSNPTEMANLINQVFANQGSAGGNSDFLSRFRGGGGFPGGGGRGRGR